MTIGVVDVDGTSADVVAGVAAAAEFERLATSSSHH